MFCERALTWGAERKETEMGPQPDFDHASMQDAGRIWLSGRQRDWLATFDSDTVIELLDQEEDGELVVAPGNDADAEVQRIPWHGALDQPVVRLEDVDQEIDELPETGERDA